MFILKYFSEAQKYTTNTKTGRKIRKKKKRSHERNLKQPVCGRKSIFEQVM